MVEALSHGVALRRPSRLSLARRQRRGGAGGSGLLAFVMAATPENGFSRKNWRKIFSSASA
jgi:hypothetical protein